MTRGKRPEAVIDEAKSFAEWMGCHWIEDPQQVEGCVLSAGAR